MIDEDLKKLHQLFDVVQSSYCSATVPNLNTRLNRLSKLQNLIVDNLSDLTQALSDDFEYRSSEETKLLEVYPAGLSLSYVKRHLRNWMCIKRRHTSIWFWPAKCALAFEPLGIIGIIVPWNCPLYLSVSPLAYAVAAGNSVILKLPEQTSRFGNLFKELIEKSFPRNEISAITGGPEIGAEFSRLPFNKIVFTGSAVTAQKILENCSSMLTPVLLELGGKSPVIVSENANIKNAAKKIIAAKFLNSGQICVAPDHVFVHESLYSEFIDQLIDEFKIQFPIGTRLCGFVSKKHKERLKALLNDSSKKGAKVESLYKYENNLVAAILTNVDFGMDVLKTEIFGPLLPVIRYTDLDEVVERQKVSSSPLAMYFFGCKKQFKILTDNTRSGAILHNEIGIHVFQDDLPFGGVGFSGYGRYHGTEGFESFSNAKSLFLQRKLNFTAAVSPPYIPSKKFFLDWMLRIVFKWRAAS